MTDNTPIKAPEATDLASELKGFQDAHKTALEGMQSMVSGFKGQLENASKESAEDRAKLQEMGEIIAKQVQAVQDNAAAIEAVQKKMAEQPVTEKEREDRITKEAIDYFKKRWISDDSKSVEEIQSWDAKRVKEDDIEAYRVATKAVRKMFRMPTTVHHELAQLTPEEQRALKTLNTGQGNLYWLENQISQEVIACFEEQTDIGSMVSSEQISRNRITYPLETDELDEAEWICETDCDPGIANLTIDGVAEIEAHEIRRAACATHQMIEDSLQPIETYVARRIGRQFTNARNRAFMVGSGVKQPRGMLNAPLNRMPTSNNAANPGELSWQDFALIFGNTIDPFLTGSEWWISRSAFAAALTIADDNNRPLMINILEGGLPRIMGAPVRVNTYMPEYSDAGGNPITGATPVMFINPQRLYRVVNRIGISVTRDPYTRAACGVVWHFRARFGGDVLCPNAATLLEITP